jgi:predicted DNA repair protein MutK
MLWVGGHLVIANIGEVGWLWAADLLHSVHDLLAPLGAVVAWVGETAISAVAGLILGLVVVGIVLGAGRMLGKRVNLEEGHRKLAATQH